MRSVKAQSTKDRAVDAILGSDAYFCVTARRHDSEHVEVRVFNGGDESMIPAMVEEMLHYSSLMLFGPREEEEVEDVGDSDR